MRFPTRWLVLLIGCASPRAVPPSSPPAATPADPLFESPPRTVSLEGYTAHTHLASPDPPWRDASVGLIGNDCAIALQLASGWYLTPALVGCQEPTFMSFAAELEQVEDAVIARVAIVHNEKKHDSDVPSGHVWVSTCEERIIVCGVDRAGAPTCTGALHVADGDCDGAPGAPPSSDPTWTWQLVPHIEAGALTFTPTGPVPAEEAKAVASTHRWR